jgi:hypothetical protein
MPNPPAARYHLVRQWASITSVAAVSSARCNVLLTLSRMTGHLNDLLTLNRDLRHTHNPNPTCVVAAVKML